jgi:hypothetical protein
MALGWAVTFAGCSGDLVPSEVGPCGEQYRTGTSRCEVSQLSCDSPDACPASWALAQARTTCVAYENEITIGACGAARVWKVSYGSPPLFRTCYYDPNDGHLAGILHESDTNEYCGNHAVELSYGAVPLSCAPDPTEQSYSCR